jgi:hypothetical protein
LIALGLAALFLAMAGARFLLALAKGIFPLTDTVIATLVAFGIAYFGPKVGLHFCAARQMALVPTDTANSNA